MRKMVIGVCMIELDVTDSNSLKDKRQVIRSLIDRIRNRFNVSVSEIAEQDRWRHAGLGMVCITTDREFASRMLNKVVEMIESEPRVFVTNCYMEML